MKRFFLIGSFVFSAIPVLAQSSFVQAFEEITDSPKQLTFENSLTVNTQGGHIQGIQQVGDYFLLSGSSSTASYYATVANNKVVRIDTLLPRPYKHAGGFQVNNGLLAIGVENNETKDVSRVLIYDYSDPANLSNQLIQVVQRKGKAKRATAGCVAIAKYQEQYLLLVGDWDTRHLDLYQISVDSIENNEASFVLTQSITLKDHPRDGWVDKAWYPYQNINLFNSEGSLYLVGLGINEQEKNVADVFTLSLEPTFELVKVVSRTFPKQAQTSFLWGAGTDWQPEIKKMRILTTPYSINSENTIVVYQ